MKMRLSTLSNLIHLRENGLGGMECFYGATCEVINLLSEKLNLKLDVIFPTDGGEVGKPAKNGSWNGLIGLLQHGKADFAPNMVFAYDKFQAVDFSPALLTESIVFATGKATEMSKDFVLLYPFQLPVWLHLLMLTLVCSFMLSLLLSYKRKPGSAGVLNNAVPSAEILFGQRSFRRIHTRIPIELFYALVVLSLRLLTFCYTAVFLSFLLAPITIPQIKTFNELGQAAKAGYIKIALPPSYTYIHRVITAAENGTLKALADNNEKNIPYSKDLNLDDLLKKGFFIINGVSFIKINTMVTFAKEDLHISSDNLGTTQGGFIFRRGFKYIKQFNEILLRLFETGVYNKIDNDYNVKKQIRKAQNAAIIEKQPFKPIRLTDLKSIFFFFMGCGFVVSTLVLICEKCLYKGKSPRKIEGKPLKFRPRKRKRLSN